MTIIPQTIYIHRKIKQVDQGGVDNNQNKITKILKLTVLTPLVSVFLKKKLSLGNLSDNKN